MEQTGRVPQSGMLWRGLAVVAEFLVTDPAKAEAHASELLELMPGHSQALQLVISARRAQGDLTGARSMLESMAAKYPRLASVHYELGLLLSDIGESEASVKALSRVVELEPDHPSAWRQLGEELAGSGNAEGAAKALARHCRSSIVDVKMLESATSLSSDRIETAIGLLREYLNIYSTDVDAIRLLAKLYMRADQYDAAESLFERALELAPDFTMARADYVGSLVSQMKWEDVARQVDILLEGEPENPAYHYTKATVLFRTERSQEALLYCENLLRETPDIAAYWLAYAYALRSVGRSEDCIAAFRKSVEIEPGIGESWWGLANLKTFRFSPADVETMRTQLARTDLAEDNRSRMEFALGRALENQKAYGESFEHYRKGNALQRAAHPYRSEWITENVRLSKVQFTREYFRKHADQGCPSPAPIFIPGLPRTGSTLIEQILSSHSSVEALGELPVIGRIVRRLAAKENAADGTPHLALEGEDLRALGEEYLEGAGAYRKLGRPYFTDKMPGNFNRLGMICAILPNARIIDMRRHPLDCCLSNFKQIFPLGSGPSYDLGDIGRHYRDYVELMAHFDEVLPGRVHRVFYEELVRNPEAEIRRLLEYCNLPFEENCLNFHQTDRSIFTASSEQVRLPVYKEGMGQWQPYEPWLGPLKTALGSVLTMYPAVPETF